jgi:hypothetical protein
MNPVTRSLIEALHHQSKKYVIVLTGGGSSVAGLLLGVPGGSRNLLEVHIPYHSEALSEFLGGRPEHSCSAATSQAMAARAYQRAAWLAAGEPVLGVGGTASLVSDRPKRGDHRFHVTVRGAQGSKTYSLTLNKGARDREGEESVLDAVVLNAMAEAAGVPLRLETPLLPGEAVQIESVAEDPLAGLLPNELPSVCVEIDGRLSRTAPVPAAIVSGSFNPVHEGHWRLAEVAATRVGGQAAFELSAINVDKPALALEEIRCRLHPFAWRAPVWLTRAPTFREKAALFPGVTFAVGIDTAERLVAPRYYQDSEVHMMEALDYIRRQGCRFLVAGRRDDRDRFICLDELKLPAACQDLFTSISQAELDVPASSTELRQRLAQAKTVADLTTGE